jgi:hypothetical protein
MNQVPNRLRWRFRRASSAYLRGCTKAGAMPCSFGKFTASPEKELAKRAVKSEYKAK